MQRSYSFLFLSLCTFPMCESVRVPRAPKEMHASPRVITVTIPDVNQRYHALTGVSLQLTTSWDSLLSPATPACLPEIGKSQSPLGSLLQKVLIMVSYLSFVILVIPRFHLVVLVACLDENQACAVIGHLPDLKKRSVSTLDRKEMRRRRCQLTSSNAYSSMVCVNWSLVNPFAMTSSDTLLIVNSPRDPSPTAAAPLSLIPLMRL